MKGLLRKVRSVLPALLVAVALPVAALPSAPATASAGAGESASESLVAWVEGWLQRLAPGWMAAATETPPPSEGIPFDDGVAIESCEPTTCTEGETLPDWDPDG